MSVKEWRKKKGNALQKYLYHQLKGMGLDSHTANRLKQMSLENINNHLYGMEVLEEIRTGTKALHRDDKLKVIQVMKINKKGLEVFDGKETFSTSLWHVEPIHNSKYISLRGEKNAETE